MRWVARWGLTPQTRTPWGNVDCYAGRKGRGRVRCEREAWVGECACPWENAVRGLLRQVGARLVVGELGDSLVLAAFEVDSLTSRALSHGERPAGVGEVALVAGEDE